MRRKWSLSCGKRLLSKPNRTLATATAIVWQEFILETEALLHLTGLAPALFLLSNFASSTLAIGSYRFDFRFHLDYDYVKRSGFGYV